jgi:hypothetical protein
MSNVRPQRELSMPGWPIPTDFPLNELIGQEVTQICVGLGQVQIHFYKRRIGDPDKWEPGARVEAESAFTLAGTQGSTRVESDKFKLTAGLISNLLGEEVTSLFRESGNELRLEFTNDLSLRLHTDPNGFESFHLHIAGDSATVTGV